MNPIQLSRQSAEQLKTLNKLYRTTKDVRLRTRTQMILLSIEKGMVAAAIAEIVRESEQTVRNWLKRYEAEGLEGLADRPRPGSPSKATPVFVERLVAAVRRRPAV